MLTPKFSTTKKDRLYITDKYICNGHWLFTRKAASHYTAPLALQKLTSLLHGTYSFGQLETTSVRNLDAIIPRLTSYVKLSDKPSRVVFSDDNIVTYIFNFKNCDIYKGEEIGIAPEYIPLLRLGCAHAKDKLSPIVVTETKEISSDLVGIIMPMRINNET